MTVGAVADHRVGVRAAGDRDRALLVRPPGQPRRRLAVRAGRHRLARVAARRARRRRDTSATSRCRSTPAAGGSAAAGEAPRVTVIALDGATLAYIMPRVAEGRLPNFSRVLEAGAVIDLATIRPTQPDPVWAAVATGMIPSKSGVRSAARYFARGDRCGIDLLPDHCFSHALVQRWPRARTCRGRRTQWAARPLWAILSDAGVTTGVVRWPLTHPSQPLAGIPRQRSAATSSSEPKPTSKAPCIRPTLLPAVPRPRRIVCGRVGHGGAAGFLDRHARSDSVAPRPDVRARSAKACGRGPAAFRLCPLRRGSTSSVITTCGTPNPQRRAEFPSAERRRFAEVIDRYYALHRHRTGHGPRRDAARRSRARDFRVRHAIARAREAHDARAGARRCRDHRHPRARSRRISARLRGGRPARRPQRGSIVDVTPTLLYFFGLPVARDMDGFARRDLFTREFTTEASDNVQLAKVA